MRYFGLCFGWTAAAAFFSTYPATAQSAEHDAGAWTVFTATDSFPRDGAPSRWRYWFDAQARFFDLGSGARQYVLRPGVGYDVSANMTVWAGFGRFYVHTADGRRSTESRYWQQLSWTAARFGNATVKMRVRLEQRSLSTGDDIALVLRYQVGYVKPLAGYPNADLILSVEPFVDLRDTDWGGESGLAQNRVFAGIGWRSSDSLSIETGYMNQYVWRDAAENTSNHLAVVNFKAKF